MQHSSLHPPPICLKKALLSCGDGKGKRTPTFQTFPATFPTTPLLNRRLRAHSQAKPAKHTAAELKRKEHEALTNMGGGKAGKADRLGGEKGHAKFAVRGRKGPSLLLELAGGFLSGKGCHFVFRSDVYHFKVFEPAVQLPVSTHRHATTLTLCFASFPSHSAISARPLPPV